jgi:BatD DUF11 like domain
MRLSRIRGIWLIAAITASTAIGTAIADAPLVYATIEPAQITLGQSAKYTITNLGNGTDSIALPVVSGLDFQVMGRSRQFEFVNGTMLPSISIVVKVTPQIAGIFSIPGITPKAPPLVLQVISDQPAAKTSHPGIGNAPVKPPIFSGDALPDGVRLTPDGSAFVRLISPRRDVYVGEMVPVEIEVGMRSGFVSSLNGLPKLTGDDLTLTNLSRQPERSEKLIGGIPFVLWAWHGALAVVKPGTFSLVAEAPLTVKIRTRPRRDSRLDDEFGDPFLQNLFGATVPKDINVANPRSQLTVLALPTEGRPADFHGAVGEFKIATDITPASAEAGDPLTLRMHVTGTGNFDRVDSAMLDHLDHWKTYPPKSSFSASDAAGSRGEKLFEQPLIAANPGAQTLPGLSFSYFDPTMRRYETARSSPLSVMISPALGDSTLSAAEVAARMAAASAHGLQSGLQSGLRPDHVLAGEAANSLIPLYLRPQFMAIPSFLALAFAGGWLGTRRRDDSNRKSSARTRRQSKAIDRAIAQLAAVAAAGDATLFLNSARAAVQQSLAVRWEMAPEQITAAEVQARLGSEGEDIRRLFALADESSYSGHGLTVSDFARWMKVVRHQLSVVLLVAGLAFMGCQARAETAQTTYSAAGLYNLANTYARAGRPGMAVLNYERASLLAPNDPDIEANLRHVRESRRLPAEPRRWYYRAAVIAPPSGMAWIGVMGLVIIGASLLSGKLFPGHRSWRVAAAGVGIALLGLTVCSGIVLWPKLHEGVVIMAGTAARVAPVPMGDSLFVLPEAETVTISAEHEGFVLVRTREGRIGWVSQASLAAVVPRSRTNQ